MKKLQKNNQSGFALITLLVFMVIGITIISASSLILITDIFSGSNAQNGQNAYYVAESGAEDASLRLLRNPTLKVPVGSEYSVTTDDGIAKVSITNPSGTGATIVSSGQIGTTNKTIRATTTYSAGQQTVTSWREQ